MFGKIFCDTLVVFSKRKNLILDYLVTSFNQMKIGSNFCGYDYEYFYCLSKTEMECLGSLDSLPMFIDMDPAYRLTFNSLKNNFISEEDFFRKYLPVLPPDDSEKKSRILDLINFDLMGLTSKHFISTKSFNEFFEVLSKHICHKLQHFDQHLNICTDNKHDPETLCTISEAEAGCIFEPLKEENEEMDLMSEDSSSEEEFEDKKDHDWIPDSESIESSDEDFDSDDSEEGFSDSD